MNECQLKSNLMMNETSQYYWHVVILCAKIFGAKKTKTKQKTIYYVQFFASLIIVYVYKIIIDKNRFTIFVLNLNELRAKINFAFFLPSSLVYKRR